MSSNGQPRILILRGGAIGDFILTLPAIRLVRERWPDAYIELAGYPHITALAKVSGLVDEVTSLDRADMARWFSLRPEIPAAQEAYVRSFDIIVQYLFDPDGTVERNMTRAGARQVLYASPIVKAGHAVEHLLKPLEALALYPEGAVVPRLALPAASLARGRGRLPRTGDRLLAIHPGSGGARKNWPLAGFLELAARLQREARCVPVWILGDAEIDIAPRLRAAVGDAPMLAGLSLVELAETLAGCHAYVGNDSGISHLAAALGIPVAAVFGPTDPALWAPRGPRVRVLYAGAPADETWSQLPVGVVLDAARKLLGQ